MPQPGRELPFAHRGSIGKATLRDRTKVKAIPTEGLNGFGQWEKMMTHTRIRPFNTRDTYPEQRLDNDLCQAVVARGATVFLRGQCPQDLDTSKNLGSHDPVEQTHKVMQNIQQLIEEAGGVMEHLVKVVVYITDVRHREPVYRTMGEYIRDVHPVSTGLVVSALARPEWLVEIDATAVIPD
jgi:enamine deaminase RidA (YjgF/YER057c/UK114 family)